MGWGGGRAIKIIKLVSLLRKSIFSKECFIANRKEKKIELM